jgi:hypothetical protein
MGTNEPTSRTRKKATNRAAHYAQRARQARTPIERATVAHDGSGEWGMSIHPTGGERPGPDHSPTRASRPDLDIPPGSQSDHDNPHDHHGTPQPST